VVAKIQVATGSFKRIIENSIRKLVKFIAMFLSFFLSDANLSQRFLFWVTFALSFSFFDTALGNVEDP
jgi:hypothetical protein